MKPMFMWAGGALLALVRNKWTLSTLTNEPVDVSGVDTWDSPVTGQVVARGIMYMYVHTCM